MNIVVGFVYNVPLCWSVCVCVGLGWKGLVGVRIPHTHTCVYNIFGVLLLLSVCVMPELPVCLPARLLLCVFVEKMGGWLAVFSCLMV